MCKVVLELLLISAVGKFDDQEVEIRDRTTKAITWKMPVVI